ncbi:hypothetical protein GNF80_05125 [Clostridium perfringens]|nr:hypothetical protein [Clostridium perfringens]
MKNSIHTKKFGMGSLALLISLFSVMFSFTYFNGQCLGQHIFSALGIVFPYGITSLILFSISYFIAYKNREDKFAKAGMTISIIFSVLILALSILSALL